MRVISPIKQLVTLEAVAKKDGRNIKEDDLSLIENAALVFDDDSIVWVGKASELPEEFKKFKTKDASHLVITPEIIDCHTHLVFAGNRAKEYVMRLGGADYQEIAKTGGGILSTMKATLNASADELFQLAVKRVERLHSLGIGTIEIKSGYGLTLDKERELSEIIDRLKKHFAPRVQILNTYMAAHAIPAAYSSSADYMKQVVLPLLEELAPKGILDFVDIFYEDGYFKEEDVKSLAKAAKKFGLPLKAHVDEFADHKGALLAAKLGAVSCEHLLCTGNEGIEALSQSQTVATLLPGTGFFLGKPQAKARNFLDQGCRVAIASDYNPGSCHLDNVILAASMAAPAYNMNLGEILTSITYNAAGALALTRQGAITYGFCPRFSFFKADCISEVFYSWGQNFSTRFQ